MSDGDEQVHPERQDRLSAIFSDIVIHAEELGRTRCPYRDRHDLCTAIFRCGHQAPIGDGDSGELACGHDMASDYRRAWESTPRSLEQTPKKRGRTRRWRARTREDRDGWGDAGRGRLGWRVRPSSPKGLL